jgi:hypothetical protein
LNGKGSVGEDARVVLARFERLSGETAGLAASCLRLFSPTVEDEPQALGVAGQGPGLSSTITVE